MLKIRAFFSVAICLLILSSCKKEDTYNADAQLAVDDKLITAFLAANPSITATKHKSGIYYQILNEGTGVTPTANSKVTVNYQGRLLNGSQFDATVAGTPATLNLTQVITGWQIGVPLIKKGGSIRLIIPSVYAYQNNSPGAGIPVNAVLDFTIELVNVQ